MADVKMGDTKTVEVGGKKLFLKPVTLGKMKRAILAFKNSDADPFETMLQYLTEVLNSEENNFANRQWLEDNMTLPVANEIINDMRIINGMGGADAFPAGAEKLKIVEKDLPESSNKETPSA